MCGTAAVLHSGVVTSETPTTHRLKKRRHLPPSPTRAYIGRGRGTPRDLQGRAETHCVTIGQRRRDAPADGTPGEGRSPRSFTRYSSGNLGELDALGCRWRRPSVRSR